ncbi:hypothetical protein N3K66_005335 [Trichothecium roseum]|uniref:Uncharacterized protein n=1 Tax=Trichothecium roseum TaxID=47278 RepID=A0ACC0UXM5_9HYPO|nr:hypothetical protein N3K66_005335 [Trichothecium roseum]
MDPFAELPEELILQILTSCDSMEAAMPLVQASPSLYRLHPSRYQYLVKAFVKKNLPRPDLVQDALAIVHFPSTTPSPHLQGPEHPSNAPRRDRNQLVNAHLRRWAAGKFPDPTLPGNVDEGVLRSLEYVSQGMWQFVDDYLSKATSGDLQAAYQRVPDLGIKNRVAGSIGSRTLSAVYCEKDPLGHTFSRDSLTHDQQCSIIKAFLHYELLCCVYGPKGSDLRRDSWRQDSEPCWDLTPRDAVVERNVPLRMWDWGLLNRFKQSDDHGNRVMRRMVIGVREYVSMTWATMRASCLSHDSIESPDQVRARTLTSHHQAGTKGTDECHYAPCPLRKRDPEPDNSFVSRHPFWELVRAHGSTDWHKMTVSLLSSAGFRCLSGVLAKGPQERAKFFDAFDESVGWSPPNVDRVRPVITAAAPMGLMSPSSWHGNPLQRVRRQRAWLLWSEDEERPGPRVPTASEFNAICGPCPENEGASWDSDSLDEHIAHSRGNQTFELLSFLTPGSPNQKIEKDKSGGDLCWKVTNLDCQGTAYIGESLI